MPKVKTLAVLTGLGAVGAAVAQELKKPASERRWHGRLGGKIPYDFRAPTIAKIKERAWNPDDPHVLTDRWFGVGWSVNFAQVRNKLKALRS
ncbi:MAG: DUF5808 domain-containing protein [Actinobacteria bacterium]|nr:DUF5808 domain-containing protein [Actinomycetota bacterium]